MGMLPGTSGKVGVALYAGWRRSVVRDRLPPDYATLHPGYGLNPATRILAGEYGRRRAPLTSSCGRRCLPPPSPPDRGGPDPAGTQNLAPPGSPALLQPEVYPACP